MITGEFEKLVQSSADGFPTVHSVFIGETTLRHVGVVLGRNTSNDVVRITTTDKELGQGVVHSSVLPSTEILRHTEGPVRLTVQEGIVVGCTLGSEEVRGLLEMPAKDDI